MSVPAPSVSPSSDHSSVAAATLGASSSSNGAPGAYGFCFSFGATTLVLALFGGTILAL